MNSVKEIRSAIVNSKLTNDDLNEIIQAITFARAQLRNQVKRTMTVGSRVQFSGRNGIVTGTLKKVAIKFATVETNMGGSWRVPLNMLEAV
jgi:hypothetical protein